MREGPEKFPPKTPDELKGKLIERAKYYTKGFGACLTSLKWTLHSYAEGRRDQSTTKYIRDTLQEITDLYSAVSLEEIANHPDYDLLSTIKGKIFQLEQETNAILEGKTDTGALDQIANEIDDTGCDFRDRLNELLRELRQYPGYEQFCFTSTDMNGRLWEQTF
jgi:hypothetical protein